MRISEVREALKEVVDKEHMAAQLYERIEDTLGDAKEEISAYGYLKYLVGRLECLQYAHIAVLPYAPYLQPL